MTLNIIDCIETFIKSPPEIAALVVERLEMGTDEAEINSRKNEIKNWFKIMQVDGYREELLLLHAKGIGEQDNFFNRVQKLLGLLHPKPNIWGRTSIIEKKFKEVSPIVRITIIQ